MTDTTIDRTNAVRTSGLVRVYGTGAAEVRALDGVDVDIEAGTLVALLGPSGSGKTTLLNVIGAIDRPDEGSILVDDVDVASLDGAALARFRKEQVAFVFQFFNLVNTLSAVENVELVAGLVGRTRSDAAAVLADVGLGDHLDRFPSQLSGGQQQRVAIARALAKDAPVLLCDEPTGALDRASGRNVLTLLRDAVEHRGRTVIVVSHDPEVALVADRVLHLEDGRIVSDEVNPDPLHPDDLDG